MSADPLDTLADLAALRDETEAAIVKTVRQCRRKAISWYDIGPALGVTRQAAAMRYAKKVE